MSKRDLVFLIFTPNDDNSLTTFESFQDVSLLSPRLDRFQYYLTLFDIPLLHHLQNF